MALDLALRDCGEPSDLESCRRRMCEQMGRTEKGKKWVERRKN